jgi:hypothetical protein
MREHHAEFESTRLRLGMQVGQARCDKYQGSPDLMPTFVAGWNWRIYTGITLGWLFWYVNFYVITPKYVKDILARRRVQADYRDQKLDKLLNELNP